MILALSLLNFISSDDLQRNKQFTRTEKNFIRNVVRAQKEKVISIVKRENNYIEIEFKSTLVILKPDGFIGEVFIKEGERWLSLGPAEEAY